MSLYTTNGSNPSGEDSVKFQRHVLWDRKAEGGFPGMSLLCVASDFAVTL